MKIRWAVPALAGLLAAATACGDDIPDDGVLAQAGDYVLTVDDAVELLVDEENLPNQTQVIQALADLWIDYTLLADATLLDSTFAHVDVSELVRQQVEGELIVSLQESVIAPDTAISDEELLEIFQRNALPIASDVTEQSVLDLVPLARPWRIVRSQGRSQGV